MIRWRSVIENNGAQARLVRGVRESAGREQAVTCPQTEALRLKADKGGQIPHYSETPTLQMPIN